MQFASVYAVMARSLGIPARVAVGFTPGDVVDGVFHVSAHDAHAWPEVWLAGLGWTHLFDPTPPADTVPTGGSDLPDELPAPGRGGPGRHHGHADTAHARRHRRRADDTTRRPPTPDPSAAGDGAAPPTPATPEVTTDEPGGGTSPWLLVALVVLLVVVLAAGYVLLVRTVDARAAAPAVATRSRRSRCRARGTRRSTTCASRTSRPTPRSPRSSSRG